MESAGDLDSAIAVLAQRGWLAERAPEVRSVLAGIARLKDYDSGAPLFLYGDEPDGIFGLVSGALDISLPRPDGQELTMHRADPGFWIGDLALIAGEARLVSVFAAEPTRVLYLAQQPLRQLATNDPRLYADFYALSHINVTLLLRLLVNLATSPSEVRVAIRLLQMEETLTDTAAGIRMSQAKLAELVALSAPTLQRVLRRLEEAGLIELGYGRIRILDRVGLLDLCNDGG
ncbi:MAG: Crp/Fnr family transcriptional regulator [Pseudomonadales bacterium]